MSDSALERHMREASDAAEARAMHKAAVEAATRKVVEAAETLLFTGISRVSVHMNGDRSYAPHGGPQFHRGIQRLEDAIHELKALEAKP